MIFYDMGWNCKNYRKKERDQVRKGGKRAERERQHCNLRRIIIVRISNGPHKRLSNLEESLLYEAAKPDCRGTGFRST